MTTLEDEVWDRGSEETIGDIKLWVWVEHFSPIENHEEESLVYLAQEGINISNRSDSDKFWVEFKRVYLKYSSFSFREFKDWWISLTKCRGEELFS